MLEPLKDVVLIEGSEAKLTCCFSAFQDLFIRWSKDSKELCERPKCHCVSRQLQASTPSRSLTPWASDKEEAGKSIHSLGSRSQCSGA